MRTKLSQMNWLLLGSVITISVAGSKTSNADDQNLKERVKPSPTVELARSEPFLPAELNQRLTIEFKDQTVADLLNWLKKEGSVNLDFTEVEPSFLEQPFRKRLIDQPVYLLLNQLNQAELSWFLEDDDVVHIYDTKDGETKQSRLYPVADLIEQGYSHVSILDFIMSNTSGSWFDIDQEGGVASISENILFVQQPFYVHWEIFNLLEKLRNGQFGTRLDETAEEARIRKILDKKFSVQFQDASYNDLAETLGKMANLDIQTDFLGLSDQGFDLDEEFFSGKFSSQPLTEILKQVCEEQQVTYYSENGTINFTPLIDCGSLHSVLYDVSDLCRNEFESEELKAQVMQHSSGPWFDIDQEGGRISFLKPGVTVIIQSPNQHDEINSFLKQLRTAKNLALAQSSKRFGDQLVTRFYALPPLVAESLANNLWELVPEGQVASSETDENLGKIVVISGTDQLSDSGDNSSKQTQPRSTLIVTHKRHIHHQIEKILLKLEEGIKKPPLEEPEGSPGFF